MTEFLPCLLFAFCYPFAQAALIAARFPVPPIVLLAANHQSYIDPPFVCLYISRHTSFVARAGLFKSRFFGFLIGSLNALPIKEDGGDSAAIKEALQKVYHADQLADELGR